MEVDNENRTDEVKLDIKNIALKAPKKSRRKNNDSFWRIFWIANIPKREGISDIRKEYSQIMETMTSD
jgi:hypothetical protein